MLHQVCIIELYCSAQWLLCMYSGTSMSAPHVAGVAALLSGPHSHSFQLTDRMRTDAASIVTDEQFGSQLLLNAEAINERARSASPTTLASRSPALSNRADGWYLHLYRGNSESCEAHGFKTILERVHLQHWSLANIPGDHGVTLI
jgi:hypothetical protein